MNELELLEKKLAALQSFTDALYYALANINDKRVAYALRRAKENFKADQESIEQQKLSVDSAEFLRHT